MVNVIWCDYTCIVYYVGDKGTTVLNIIIIIIIIIIIFIIIIIIIYLHCQGISMKWRYVARLNEHVPLFRFD